MKLRAMVALTASLLIAAHAHAQAPPKNDDKGLNLFGQSQEARTPLEGVWVVVAKSADDGQRIETMDREKKRDWKRKLVFAGDTLTVHSPDLKAPATYKLVERVLEPSLATLMQILGKSIKSKEEQAFRDAMGSEPNRGSYVDCCWRSKGIRLEFHQWNGLTAVQVFAGGMNFNRYLGELPAGLSFDDSRADIERILESLRGVGGRSNESVAGYYYVWLDISRSVHAQILVLPTDDGDRLLKIIISGLPQ